MRLFMTKSEACKVDVETLQRLQDLRSGRITPRVEVIDSGHGVREIKVIEDILQDSDRERLPDQE